MKLETINDAIHRRATVDDIPQAWLADAWQRRCVVEFACGACEDMTVEDLTYWETVLLPEIRRRIMIMSVAPSAPAIPVTPRSSYSRKGCEACGDEVPSVQWTPQGYLCDDCAQK